MICFAWGQNRKMRRAYARFAHLGSMSSRNKLLWYAQQHITRRKIRAQWESE